MDRKYLILKFNNARLIRSKDTRDRVSTPLGYTARKDKNTVFVEPITVFQISNVLHVLFNERPVPSMRKVFYEINQKYLDMANQSYLRIDNVKDNITGEYLSEMITVEKSVVDAWIKKPHINWTICKEFMGTEFNWFISDINALLNIDALKHDFRDVCDQLRITDCSNLKEKVINAKRKPFVDYLNNTTTGGKQKGSLNISGMTSVPNRSAITAISGIDSCLNLRGEIIVPIDESELVNIYKNSCNILDGGIVWIDDVLDNVSFENFRKVSEISTEKITLK